jgi:hypothetical protein
MTPSLLVEYYMLMPFVILSLMLIAYIAVRWALDVRDQYQARRMAPHSQTYGGANYMAMHRPNIRVVR